MTKTWTMSHVPSAYTDKMLKETPVYSTLQTLNPELPEKDLLSLTKETLIKKWDATLKQREPELLEKLLKILDDYGYDDEIITINRREKIIEGQRGPTTRFHPEDYVKYIGEEFQVEKISPNHPERNGIYSLKIEAPGTVTGYKTPPPVNLRLVDPTGFELRWPPQKANRPKSGDGFKEVGSITQLTGASKGAWPQSPAVIFGLAGGWVKIKK